MKDFNAPELPRRSRPAHLPVLDAGTRLNIVFLTVCTLARQPVLTGESMHRTLIKAWSAAAHWRVGRYILMPDHLHLFCAPNCFPVESLTGWVTYWKRLVTQEHGAAVWQKNFWDTQLRRHESYAAKWEYVRQNPVRAGLVNDAHTWPFQGELNVLLWRE